MKSSLTRGALLAGAATLALAMSACGSDGDPAPEGSSTTQASSAPPSSAAPVPDEPFGAGCSTVPADGEGSLTGMADDPVATAAGNNPVLSRLVGAVRTANLVDSLNTTQDITVLAPANPAFEAVPPETLDPLLADSARLTAVLTHHVIPGRLAPGDLAGRHTTLSGDEVTIEGSGESFSVSADQTVVGAGPASVICGNVRTANATVYVIDQVLAPPAP